MRISIAMATYNGERYLGEQLQSFADQTRLPDELVVTDDCSTDSTMEILGVFAASAPFPVKVSLNPNNLGYAGNFNAALSKTTGDLVFLSDQDDVWFSTKLEHVEQLAMRNPDKLVILNDARLTDAELKDTGLTKLGQIYAAGYTERQFVMGCCCAVRRQLLELCLPILEGVRAHDIWLRDFAEPLSSRLITNEVLQFYRRHERNESQFGPNSILRRKRHALDRLGRRLRRAPVNVFRFQNELEQLNILEKGYRRAIERSNRDDVVSAYQHALTTVREKISKRNSELALLVSCRKIRSSPITRRFGLFLNLFRDSEYRSLLGFRRMLRLCLCQRKQANETDDCQ